MRKLFYAAAAYAALGLASGLYYRDLTKLKDFTGDTQLSVVHTHLLALGMLFFLLVLALDKSLGLSKGGKLFSWFFWTYNAGLAVTAGSLTAHGTLTVFGKQTGPAMAGIAGLGHIMLTAGVVLFFVLVYKRVKQTELATAKA